MKIVDKRSNKSNSTTNPVPGAVIFYNNLLITDDPYICVDLSTGELLGSPIEVFDSQILNNVELVVK